MTNPYAYKIKPKGFMLRILRVDQAAAAPILDGGLVYDRLEDHTDPPHGVPMVETEPLHGLIVMPWRLWTTTRADRPAVNALGVFWLRGTSPNPARWTPSHLAYRARRRRRRARKAARCWVRGAVMYAFRKHLSVQDVIDIGDRHLRVVIARRVGDRLLDLLLLLLQATLHWALGLRVPAWIDRRLPVRDAPVRGSNARRNGVGVPTVDVVVHPEFFIHTTPEVVRHTAEQLNVMRGMRGGFDA